MGRLGRAGRGHEWLGRLILLASAAAFGPRAGGGKEGRGGFPDRRRRSRTSPCRHRHASRSDADTASAYSISSPRIEDKLLTGSGFFRIRTPCGYAATAPDVPANQTRTSHQPRSTCRPARSRCSVSPQCLCHGLLPAIDACQVAYQHAPRASTVRREPAPSRSLPDRPGPWQGSPSGVFGAR